MTSDAYQYLDLSQAKDIAGEGAPLHQLVEAFESSLREEVSKINLAFANQDQASLEFSLHTLKGFMAIFVAPSLALQVELLYKNCRNAPMQASESEFNTLVPSFETLLEEVRTWLSL